MIKKLLCLTALSSLWAACSKDDPKPAGESAATKTTEPKSAPKKAAGPAGSWDMDARRAAFQGAHVTGAEAWQVDGDKVTIWNGTVDKSLELTLESPCSVKTTERTADGSSSSTTHHYTLKNGAIVMGLGDAGARSGSDAIACVSNQIVTLDAAGTCTQWELDIFGEKWESKPGTCAFVKDGDKEWFSVTLDSRETRLVVDGDVILSEQLAGRHSEKVADFATAKAALAQK